jgi:hypothetical protein
MSAEFFPEWVSERAGEAVENQKLQQTRLLVM